MSTMYILPGSIEFEADGTITVGVHTGTNAWDVKNLKFVRGNASEMKHTDTVETFCFRLYEEKKFITLH